MITPKLGHSSEVEDMKTKKGTAIYQSNIEKYALCLVTALIFMTVPYICWAEAVKISPGQSVIVLPAGQNDSIIAASQELSKHLKLITGTDIELIKDNSRHFGKYPFYIGVPVPGDKKQLAAEEARWVITPEATYIYGDDSAGHSGTQFAVYGFLEDELGIRWIEPGDQGIAYKKQPVLTLATGEFTWIPKLGLRKIRQGVKLNQPPQLKAHVAEFKDFLGTREDHNKYVEEVVMWQKRMRMGGHISIPYGHAFTTWWKQYGKTHPEYFALNGSGRREPDNINSDKSIYTEDNPRGFQNIKLCTSNPKVAEQIIQNWLSTPNRKDGINVCENDSPPANFCTCPACRELDVINKGEKFGDHLTDRYVYLANMVARKAREHNPNAFAVMYAYNETEQPPRKLKLESNVVVVLVPTTAEIPKLKELFRGWHEAGARKMVLRPNLHTYYFTTTLPMGFEKQMFDVFQTAFEQGFVVGTDYDSLTHHWPVTGLADYTLAKAFSDPSKPFEYWEEQYYSAYGTAAGDVKRYFRYWRYDLWEKRLQPDMENIVERGRSFNFVRGVMRSINKYYKPEDFDRTDAMLQEASKKDLADSERAHLKQLILANRHARLVFNAVASEGLDKDRHSMELLDFREKFKDVLHIRWIAAFAAESRFGDITGIKAAIRKRSQ